MIVIAHRSWLKLYMIIRKPSPSLPIRLRTGTRTSSNERYDVPDDDKPWHYEQESRTRLFKTLHLLVIFLVARLFACVGDRAPRLGFWDHNLMANPSFQVTHQFDQVPSLTRDSGELRGLDRRFGMYAKIWQGCCNNGKLRSFGSFDIATRSFSVVWENSVDS